MPYPSRGLSADTAAWLRLPALGCAAVIALAWAPERALAQVAPTPPVVGGPPSTPVTPPPVTIVIPPVTPASPIVVVSRLAAVRTDIIAGMPTNAAMLDLGSNFLRRQSYQSSNSIDRTLRNNPGGGGAPEADEQPRYRSWAELYGVTAHTDAVGDFAGDKRRTVGGVAGIGARLMPGVNLGLSVDQSHTAIDVPLALQSANLDLTQVGVNASVDKGDWTWALALVHGFGRIDSRRDTGAGLASAAYNARIDGALTELSYFWNSDQARIVPKLAFEYTRAVTDGLQEAGGLDPVSATGATAERARLLVGAEVGRYWIFDQKIFDISAYGKFVDNVHQGFSDVTVSLGTDRITVQGIGESQYGADAGAAASLSLTNTLRVYLNYDGKFRSYSQSHQATLGVEVKF